MFQKVLLVWHCGIFSASHWDCSVACSVLQVRQGRGLPPVLYQPRDWVRLPSATPYPLEVYSLLTSQSLVTPIPHLTQFFRVNVPSLHSRVVSLSWLDSKLTQDYNLWRRRNTSLKILRINMALKKPHTAPTLATWNIFFIGCAFGSCVSFVLLLLLK